MLGSGIAIGRKISPHELGKRGRAAAPGRRSFSFLALEEELKFCIIGQALLELRSCAGESGVCAFVHARVPKNVDRICALLSDNEARRIAFW